MKHPRQPPLFEPGLPANVIVVRTDDLDLLKPNDSETLLRRMLDVPLDKSILLDYLVGRKRGEPHASEEHAEWHRLMAFMNSRFRSKRFDFMGESLTARMLRQSIRDLPQILEHIRLGRSLGRM